MDKRWHLYLVFVLVVVGCVPNPTAKAVTAVGTAAPSSQPAHLLVTVTPVVLPAGNATPTSVVWRDSQVKIVFAGWTLRIRNPNIFVVNADGSGFVNLTDNWDPHVDYSGAVWSPDGGRIAFVSTEQDKDSEIGVINQDGSGLRWLTDNAADDWTPAWSPGGEYIAFTSRGDGTRAKLYIVRPDGSDLERVTREGDYVEQSPDWSPTGDQIVFVARGPEAGPGNAHLRVVNVDGTAERRLTVGSQNIDIPRWSPDGRWIAYMIWPRDQGKIWFDLVSADGSQLIEPRADGVQDFLYPVWSPDGKRLAFAVVEESSPNVTSLAVMDVDTLKWQKLTEDVDDAARCWLPDGRRIIYRSGDELWIIGDDGSNAHRIAQDMRMSDCFPHYSRQ